MYQKDEILNKYNLMNRIQSLYAMAQFL